MRRRALPKAQVGHGQGAPVAPAELTWALIMASMRRVPQYIGNLKHGAWQQSGLKASSMPANFGIGMVLNGKTLGVWGYGRIGQLVAGYARCFGMRVMVWGSESARERAELDGHASAHSCESFFEECDVLSASPPQDSRHNQSLLLRQMALKGLGVVILPSFIVGPDVKRGALVSVMADHIPQQQTINAVYPPSQFVPAPVRAFIDFMVGRCNPKPSWDV